MLRSFCREQSGELLLLDLEAAVQRHLEASVDRFLRGAQSVGRTVDERSDKVARGGVDIVWSHDPIDQPNGQGFGRLDEPTGEDEVLGARRPDEPRQALGAAGTGDDTEQDLRLPELHVVAADPEVGAQRQLAAAADA